MGEGTAGPENSLGGFVGLVPVFLSSNHYSSDLVVVVVGLLPPVG